MTRETECHYEPSSDELGNCPNCTEVVVRETIFFGARAQYYWPCPQCGYTHYGETIPALD